MTRNRLSVARNVLVGVLAFAAIVALVVVLTTVVLIALPFILSTAGWFYLDERLFRFRLWRAGRMARWDAARKYLQTGGTLMIEIPASGAAVDRLWLFRDRLGKLDPDAPWDAFQLLEQQLRGETPTLTAGDQFTQWCRTNLRQLARSAVLIPAIPGRPVWQYVNELPYANRRVAFVLSPDLTTAVRRSLSWKKR